MRKINMIVDKIDSAIFFIAQVAMFIMMLITALDAFLRYVFNSPLTGAYHFSEKYLMVIIVFFSISYVMRLNGHIKIDLLTEKMPEKLQRFFEVIYSLLAAVLMFLIGYKSMGVTYEAFINQYTSSGLIPWPTWLSWVWVPIGSYLFCLRLLIHSINSALGIKQEVIDISEPDNT
ncbi:TRAP transporter small permease [Pseudogracilibacillus sp. SE30717A]|uniref:TRAP transporter small permease n=1 Tax=Pseudogracilibacillus sp. SE30717A TaxID=3098293 RepID=UPI00300DF6CF